MVVPKTTRVEYDSPRKNQFIGYLRAGGKVKEAVKENQIDLSSAYKIRRHYYRTGTTHYEPWPGRLSKVSPRMVRLIHREAVTHRREIFRDIGNSVEPKLSAWTVGRYLAKQGYHRRVARRVPYLTKAHKRARMAWARRFLKYTALQWGKVIFSDECYVCLDDTHGRIFITRWPDEEFNEDCLVPTFKQSPVCVMVWGCVMKGEKGPLVVLDYPGGKGGGMNSKRYQTQVLNGVLRQWWTKMNRKKKKVLFEQDNAKSHVSKLTLHWFKTHHIPLFPQPPQSPDLPPIENC